MASLTNATETFQHFQVMRRDDGTLWELGRGAMGVTYKAFDMNLRAPVALKVINALHLDSETSRARFVREARAAAGLRHRNVASVYHLGQDDQSFFYAMEFVDGDTVEGLVKSQGVLKPQTALQVALQVSRALGAAAKQQLVHRDIKPANLMVVSEDDDEDQLIVKVIDFGLARPALGGEGSAHITMGGFVGTPQYASPEQLEEKELDARSDIYSLGVTLWYMLAGKPPFSGALGSVFIQQLTKEPPWEHLAGVPQPVKDLLAHMLAKDPDTRPQSPTALRREIEACLKKLPSESGRIVIPHGSGQSDADTVSTLSETATHDSTGSDTSSLTARTEELDEEDITSARTAAPAAGAVVGGHFALDLLVGEGNHGRVFRARDLAQNSAIVAVKLLHPDVLAEPAQIQQLQANLEKLRTSPHPNLLEYSGLHRNGDTRFLVGEWVSGFNLVELLRTRGHLGTREAFLLLAQAAAVADHAKNSQLPRLELELHQILAHFPEAAHSGKGTDTGAKTMLGLPVDRWPRFSLKIDSLGMVREAGDSVVLPGDMTMLPTRPGLDRDTQTSIRGLVEGTYIFALGSLVYELLSGSPPPQNRLDDGRDTRYVALPALNEPGNAVLRKSLSANPGFATSTEFFHELLEASGFSTDILPVIASEPEEELAAETLETLIIETRAARPTARGHEEASAETLVAPEDRLAGETSDGASAETMVENRTFAPEPQADESSAETIALPDDQRSALKVPPVVVDHSAGTSDVETPAAGSSIITARSAETVVPPHSDAPDPALEEGVEAPTLQGYSFVSRGSGSATPPEIRTTDSQPPVIEKDDYGSDGSEAPTLQGVSFRSTDSQRPVTGKDAADADGSEAPTLQGVSFKTPPAVVGDVVLHPQVEIVHDTYGSEDVEALTLEGYSFKTAPADSPEIEIHLPEGGSAPSQERGAPPAADAKVEEFDAPTLAGYSFQAHVPEVVIPPSDDAPPAPTDAPFISEKPVDADAAASAVDIPQEKLPEPATISSEFLTVADAPVPEPPPAVPTEARADAESKPVSEPPALPTDQAEVSMEVAELKETPRPSVVEPSVLEVAEALPALRGIATDKVEKTRTSPPAIETPFVDRPIVEEADADGAKKPNFALIGGVAAIVVVGLVGGVFALRGNHPQPEPNKPVVKLETPGPVQKPVVLNKPVATPSPASVQPTPVVAVAVPTPMPTAAPIAQADNPPTAVETPAPTPEAMPTAPIVVPIAKRDSDEDRAASTPTLGKSRTSDDDETSSDNRTRHTAQENSRHHEPVPTPRVASRDREDREPARPAVERREPKPTPERAPVVKREPKPEAPRPTAAPKKEAPKPTPEAERARGPAVPFMR